MSRGEYCPTVDFMRLLLAVVTIMMIVGSSYGRCEVRLLNYQWTCTDVLNLSVYAVARAKYNVTIYEPELASEPETMAAASQMMSAETADVMTTFILEHAHFPPYLEPLVELGFTRDVKLFVFSGKDGTENIELRDIRNDLRRYTFNFSQLSEALPGETLDLCTSLDLAATNSNVTYLLYPKDVSSFPELCHELEIFIVNNEFPVVPISVSLLGLKRVVRSLLYSGIPFLFAGPTPSMFSNTNSMGFQEVVKEGRSLILASTGKPAIVATKAWLAQAEHECPEFVSFLRGIDVTADMMESALKLFGKNGTNVQSDSTRIFEVGLVAAAHQIVTHIAGNDHSRASNLLSSSGNNVNPIVIPSVPTDNITYTMSSKKGGDKIIVALWNCEPFVRCKKGSITSRVGDGVHYNTTNAEGLFLDVWGRVLRDARISPDQLIEYRCQPASFANTFLDVSFGLADVFISCGFITAERSSKMATVPIFDGGSRILTKINVPAINKWWFVNVFSSGVWGAFLLFVFSNSFILYVMVYIIRNVEKKSTVEKEADVTSPSSQGQGEGQGEGPTDESQEVQDSGGNDQRQKYTASEGNQANTGHGHAGAKCVSGKSDQRSGDSNMGLSLLKLLFWLWPDKSVMWSAYVISGNPDTEDGLGIKTEGKAKGAHAELRRRLIRMVHSFRLFHIVVGIIILSLYTANLAAKTTTSSIRDVIEEPSDLENKAVTSLCGSTSDQWLMKTNLHNGEYKCVSSVEDGVRKVYNGTVDAFVYDDATIRWWAQHSCHIDPVGDVFAQQNYGLFFSPTFELFEVIQPAVWKLVASNTVADLAWDYIPASTQCKDGREDFSNPDSWPLKHPFSKEASHGFIDDKIAVTTGPSEIRVENLREFLVVSGVVAAVLIIVGVYVGVSTVGLRRYVTSLGNMAPGWCQCIVGSKK